MATRAPLAILAAGLVTFGVVFTLLEFSPSAAQAPPAEPSPSPTPTLVAAGDSLAPRLAPGDVALGVPTGGSEALLRGVQPGDRLDILASLTSPPVTTVLVRGATVVEPATPNTPLLLEVAAPDGIVLAHAVMSGTRLGFVLWPAGAVPPPVDAATARDALSVTVTVTPTPTSAAPPVRPTPGPGSGFLYQVQPNDTWDTIASTFDIPVAELRQWNESPSDQPTPGSLVFIPRSS
jgi:LysM repeat protein